LLKKKPNKNLVIGNNDDLCKAAALWIPNIFGVVVLGNKWGINPLFLNGYSHIHITLTRQLP
jgi:hypothetical protein